MDKPQRKDYEHYGDFCDFNYGQALKVYANKQDERIAKLERQRDSALNYLREHYSSAYDPVRQIFGIELEFNITEDEPVCPTCGGETRLFYDADGIQVDNQDIDRMVQIKKCPDCGKDGE